MEQSFTVKGLPYGSCKNESLSMCLHVRQEPDQEGLSRLIYSPYFILKALRSHCGDLSRFALQKYHSGRSVTN